VRFRPIQLD